MTRHVLDHNRPQSAERTERFARIERQHSAEGSHRAAQELHRRAQTRSDSRLGQYLRIERGHQA